VFSLKLKILQSFSLKRTDNTLDFAKSDQIGEIGGSNQRLI